MRMPCCRRLIGSPNRRTDVDQEVSARIEAAVDARKRSGAGDHGAEQNTGRDTSPHFDHLIHAKACQSDPAFDALFFSGLDDTKSSSDDCGWTKTAIVSGNPSNWTIQAFLIGQQLVIALQGHPFARTQAVSTT